METFNSSSAFMKTEVWLDSDILERLNATLDVEKGKTLKEICNIAQQEGLTVSNSGKDPACITGSLAEINVLQKGIECALAKHTKTGENNFLDLLRNALQVSVSTGSGHNQPVINTEQSDSETLTGDEEEYTNNYKDQSELFHFTVNSSGPSVLDFNNLTDNGLGAHQSLSQQNFQQPGLNKTEGVQDHSLVSKRRRRSERLVRAVGDEALEELVSKEKTVPSSKESPDRDGSVEGDCRRTCERNMGDSLDVDSSGDIPSNDCKPLQKGKKVGRVNLVNKGGKKKRAKVQKYVDRSKRSYHTGLAARLRASYDETALGLQCKECTFITKTKICMNNHILRCHRERGKKCHVCNKSFAINRDLRLHVRAHVGFPCERCGKVLHTKRGIKEHIETHDQGYHCPTCGKVFRTTHGYRFHVKTHEDGYVKPQFPCERCGVIFSTPYILNVHVEKVHLGNDHKIHKCDFCEKAFTTRHVLREHRTIHTGETPFKCNICGEAFKYTGAVRSHKKKVHNIGHKIYQCQVCLKTFPYRSSLHTHSKIHGGKPEFQCKFCEWSFYQKGAMLRHMRIHTGESSEVCSSEEKPSRRLTRQIPDQPSKEYLEKRKTDLKLQKTSRLAAAAAAKAAAFKKQASQNPPTAKIPKSHRIVAVPAGVKVNGPQGHCIPNVPTYTPGSGPLLAESHSLNNLNSDIPAIPESIAPLSVSLNTDASHHVEGQHSPSLLGKCIPVNIIDIVPLEPGAEQLPGVQLTALDISPLPAYSQSQQSFQE